MSNYLVLKCNAFSDMTVASIKAHDPDAIIKCVNQEESVIGTALRHCNEPTLVLKSGLLFRGSFADLPMDVVERNPLCVSEFFVFFNHPTVSHHYDLLGMDNAAGNSADLSVFIINPRHWINTPTTDRGLLGDIKKAWMPRYMNHRADILVTHSLPMHDCMYYGMLGVSALTLSYLTCLEKRSATIEETVAYPFDHFLPFANMVEREDRLFLEDAAKRTRSRIGSMRDGMAKRNGLRNRLEI